MVNITDPLIEQVWSRIKECKLPERFNENMLSTASENIYLTDSTRLSLISGDFVPDDFDLVVKSNDSESISSQKKVLSCVIEMLFEMNLNKNEASQILKDLNEIISEHRK